MKTTALKLLNLVYREHKLPVIGIDNEITIPLKYSELFFTPLRPDCPEKGWYLGERTETGFSISLHLDENGNLFYVDDDFDGFDEWWIALVRWCVDRLY